MTPLEARIAKLEERLQDGFTRIGEAMENGIEVDNWERVWIDLLREYEQVSDEFANAKPEQAEMPGLPRSEAA